jgi:hypothetical protein
MQRSTSWSRPISGIDIALDRFRVQIDAIFGERGFLLFHVGGFRLLRLRLILALGGAGDGARFAVGRILGDAMGDEVDRVIAGHVLFLQEIGGVRLPLGEDRDEHVGARHLGPAGGLHVDRRALDHPLEGGGGHRFGPFDVGDEGRQVILDEVDQRRPQFLEIDAAGLHDLLRVGFVDKREKKMFERCKLVPPGVRVRQCGVNGLLQCVRKRWHARAPFGDIECVRAAPRSWPLGIKLWFLSASFKLFLNKLRCTGGVQAQPIGFADRCPKNRQCATERHFRDECEPSEPVLAPTNFREHVGVCRRLHI